VSSACPVGGWPEVVVGGVFRSPGQSSTVDDRGSQVLSCQALTREVTRCADTGSRAVRPMRPPPATLDLATRGLGPHCPAGHRRRQPGKPITANRDQRSPCPPDRRRAVDQSGLVAALGSPTRRNPTPQGHLALPDPRVVPWPGSRVVSWPESWVVLWPGSRVVLWPGSWVVPWPGSWVVLWPGSRVVLWPGSWVVPRLSSRMVPWPHPWVVPWPGSRVVQSLMPRAVSQGRGSCLRPLASQISKWRWVPVDWPRLPIRAIWSPALTWAPSLVVMESMWP
jgi:hypothetical protein